MLGILMSPLYFLFIRVITQPPYQVTVNCSYSVEDLEAVNIYLEKNLKDERAFVYPLGQRECGIVAFNRVNDGELRYKRFSQISKMVTDRLDSLIEAHQNSAGHGIGGGFFSVKMLEKSSAG